MQAVLAVRSGFVWQILAGQLGFAATILFLRLIKKIDWTVVPRPVSLTRWPSAAYYLLLHRSCRERVLS